MQIWCEHASILKGMHLQNSIIKCVCVDSQSYSYLHFSENPVQSTVNVMFILKRSSQTVSFAPPPV